MFQIYKSYVDEECVPCEIFLQFLHSSKFDVFVGACYDKRVNLVMPRLSASGK